MTSYESPELSKPETEIAGGELDERAEQFYDAVRLREHRLSLLQPHHQRPDEAVAVLDDATTSLTSTLSTAISSTSITSKSTSHMKTQQHKQQQPRNKSKAVTDQIDMAVEA